MAQTHTPIASRLNEEYLSKAEFAAFLNRHQRTLDNWALRGFGPPRITINGTHFYRRDAVRDWLNSHEQGAR